MASVEPPRGHASVFAARARWHGLAPVWRGALWMLLSALLFAVMGVLVKWLGSRLDSFQVAFFRAGFGFLSVLPFALAGGADATTRSISCGAPSVSACAWSWSSIPSAGA